MFADLKRVGLAALSLCLVVGLTGCPVVPFTASGTYEGNWTADVAGIPADCPLTMSLQQTGLFGVVYGTVTFDYSCFLPQALIDGLGLSQLTVPVLGTLQSDGSLKLTFDPSAVTGDLGFTIVVEYDGTGEDANADGIMDAYDGTFAFTWTIQTDLPGFAEFEIAVEGDFAVALATD